jgi:hypothetical protein
MTEKIDKPSFEIGYFLGIIQFFIAFFPFVVYVAFVPGVEKLLSWMALLKLVGAFGTFGWFFLVMFEKSWFFRKLFQMVNVSDDKEIEGDTCMEAEEFLNDWIDGVEMEIKGEQDE